MRGRGEEARLHRRGIAQRRRALAALAGGRAEGDAARGLGQRNRGGQQRRGLRELRGERDGVARRPGDAHAQRRLLARHGADPALQNLDLRTLGGERDAAANEGGKCAGRGLDLVLVGVRRGQRPGQAGRGGGRAAHRNGRLAPALLKQARIAQRRGFEPRDRLRLPAQRLRQSRCYERVAQQVAQSLRRLQRAFEAQSDLRFRCRGGRLVASDGLGLGLEDHAAGSGRSPGVRNRTSCPPPSPSPAQCEATANSVSAAVG